MFEWFSALPTWFQMIVVLAVVICSTVLFLQLIRQGFNLRYGHSAISAGPKKADRNPCHGCKEALNVMKMNRHRDELMQELHGPLMYDPMKDQMSFALGKLESVATKILDTYFKALKSKHPETDITGLRSYQSFRYVVFRLKDELMEFFRYSFQNNHYASMDDMEFRRMTDFKTDAFISSIKMMVNHCYYNEDEITKDQLFGLILGIENDLRDDALDIFSNARKISIEQKRRMDDVKMEIAAIDESYL